jgi:hypothetical protein
MHLVKLLTLSALVGVFLSHGQLVNAVPVKFGIVVSSACTVKSNNQIVFLFPNFKPPESQLQSNGGSVTVVCNDSSKSLKLTIDSAQSVVYNGTARIQFQSNSSAFNTPQPSGLSTGPIIVGISQPTSKDGDTGLIRAVIDAPNKQKLRVPKQGNYTIVVKAEITP